MDRSRVFARLRPICVQLTKEHTRENIDALSKNLLGIDRCNLQELQEYVIFPLRIILKTEKPYKDDLYTDLFTCMERVVSATRMNNWEMFYDIFNSACTRLGDPAKPGKIVESSEELKLAIVQMLKALLHNSDYHIIQKLYSVWSLPILGFAVTVLLNVAEKGQARTLKIAALECLLEVCQDEHKYCSKVKTMLGDTLSSFLPGMSIALCQMISADSKQSQKVIVTSLNLLTRLWSLVMSDSLIRESQQKWEQTAKPKFDEKLDHLVTIRNKEWVKGTSSKLKVIIKQVSKVRCHSNWKVRLSLCSWAGVLLQHCPSSLNECIPDLLEILVIMISDDYETVASSSRKHLELFRKSNAGRNCQPLLEILEENLHALCLSLPRQINGADEDQKLPIVLLLSGYLSLLGPQLTNVLMSLSHVKRLLMSLVQVLELDCSDVKIVEERTSMIGHGASALESAVPDMLQPKKQFRYFRNKKIYLELMNICHTLGYYGKLTLLVDLLLDIFHESSFYRLQAILMINNIIGGVHKSRKDCSNIFSANNFQCTDEELHSVVGMVTEEYLSPSNINLDTSANLADPNLPPEKKLKAITLLSQDNTVASYNRNIMQICLIIEGFGQHALVMGEEYVPYLMKTLYVILEKLGDDTAYISTSAFLCLCDICKACQCRSIDELLQNNADYLVNGIALRLRHYSENKRCPRVLKVMLQYSSAQLLPLIKDTVLEILESLDDHYDQDGPLFMEVLCELTKAVRRWFPCLLDIGSNKFSPPVIQRVFDDENKMSALEFSAYFADYCKQKRIACGDIEVHDEVEDGGNLQENMVEREELEESKEYKKVPLHLELVKEVMLRCKHLLTADNPRMRLVVLETIHNACYCLASCEDELLPMVHEIWAPFSRRFADEDKIVIKKALEVLLSLAKVSKDFIRQRTVKDVFPKISSFLKQQSFISCHAGHAYVYTLNYKLQLSILKHIGLLCKELSVRCVDLDAIMSTCLFYLSVQQPKNLQQAALESCGYFIAIAPDIMWLKLNDLSATKEYTHTSLQFMKVKFQTPYGSRNEYTDNVNKLFCSYPVLADENTAPFLPYTSG